MVFLVVQSGIVANPGTAMGIASAKASLTFSQAFIRGVMCNWLVCMAGKYYADKQARCSNTKPFIMPLRTVPYDVDNFRVQTIADTHCRRFCTNRRREKVHHCIRFCIR